MAFLDQRRFDPLLLGSPIRRTPVAIALAVVLLLLIAFVALVFLGLLGEMQPAVFGVFVLALALSSLMSLVPLAILWFLDRRERETPWVFALAFLWGAFIATGLAMPFNTALIEGVAEWVAQYPEIRETLGPDAAMMLVAPVAGPLVEEITKGIGLLVLFFFLRAEFDNMRDGFVYGALIGLGFTWLESALYVAQNFAQFGIAPWGAQFGGRYALFGLSGHAMFTGIFGAMLGLALQTRRRWLQIVAPIVGLLLAIAAHALNNVLPLIFALSEAAAGKAPPTEIEPPPDYDLLEAWLRASVADLVVFLPFVVIMTLVLWRSGVWERRVIREELADEVGPTLSAAEYAAIEGDRMFRTRRIERGQRNASAAIVNAQHELAFRKRRVRDGGGDPERDPLVSAWREAIRRRPTGTGR